MAALRRAVAVIGVGYGLMSSHNVVSSEHHHVEQRNWLSWLVGSAKNGDAHASGDPPIALGLKEIPGRVVVWGGKFGRSPRLIQGLRDDAIKVAASDGIGAVVNRDGAVHSFRTHGGTDLVQEIAVPGLAVDVSIMERESELVILDSSGRVSVAQYHDGKFEPAKLLTGAIKRSTVRKIRCGKEHCIAVTDLGDAFSWGSTNSHGQLGTGTVGVESRNGNISLPKKVLVPPGTKIVDAACGDRHTLFLDKNGDVFGAGDDHWAQLGISAEPWLKSHAEFSGEVRKSELIEGLAGYTIAGGGQHSVMLVRDGTVFTFGFNQWGQLAHHNYSTLAPPSPIADYTFRALAISAGGNHTCVVKENGELWCIGGNDQGQLGTGNLQPSMIWRKVRIGKKTVRPSCIYAMGNVTAAIVPPMGSSDAPA